MINAELCRYVMQYPDVLYDVLQYAVCRLPVSIFHLSKGMLLSSCWNPEGSGQDMRIKNYVLS